MLFTTTCLCWKVFTVQCYVSFRKQSQSNMVRSRKDSTGSNVVEQYRKQIAKQDTKKSKDSLRETKFRAEKKENAPAVYKEIATMIVALLAVCLCVYCLFYALLTETAK